MRIGLAYDLKAAMPMAQDSPEDALEEYDSAETIEIISAALEAKGHAVVRLGGGAHFLDVGVGRYLQPRLRRHHSLQGER